MILISPYLNIIYTTLSKNNSIKYLLQFLKNLSFLNQNFYKPILFIYYKNSNYNI